MPICIAEKVAAAVVAAVEVLLLLVRSLPPPLPLTCIFISELVPAEAEAEQHSSKRHTFSFFCITVIPFSSLCGHQKRTLSSFAQLSFFRYLLPSSCAILPSYSSSSNPQVQSPLSLHLITYSLARVHTTTTSATVDCVCAVCDQFVLLLLLLENQFLSLSLSLSLLMAAFLFFFLEFSVYSCSRRLLFRLEFAIY